MNRQRHILFAPGAITRHTSAQRRALLRWLMRAFTFMAFATTAALVAGIVYEALQA